MLGLTVHRGKFCYTLNKTFHACLNLKNCTGVLDCRSFRLWEVLRYKCFIFMRKNKLLFSLVQVRGEQQVISASICLTYAQMHLSGPEMTGVLLGSVSTNRGQQSIKIKSMMKAHIDTKYIFIHFSPYRQCSVCHTMSTH